MSEQEKIVKLFIGSHCSPCQKLKELMTEGKFLVDGEKGKVDMVDVETEEGFLNIEKYNLELIPAAIDEKGDHCSVSIEDETVVIECNK